MCVCLSLSESSPNQTKKWDIEDDEGFEDHLSLRTTRTSNASTLSSFSIGKPLSSMCVSVCVCVGCGRVGCDEVHMLLN